MSLNRLAKELEETARQSGEMVATIYGAIETLASEPKLTEPEKAEALKTIVVAMQSQDRIEQRCRNMADAVKALAQSEELTKKAFADAWSKLTLEELAVPALSGIAAVEEHGECEFF